MTTSSVLTCDSRAGTTKTRRDGPLCPSPKIVCYFSWYSNFSPGISDTAYTMMGRAYKVLATFHYIYWLPPFQNNNAGNKKSTPSSFPTLWTSNVRKSRRTRYAHILFISIVPTDYPQFGRAYCVAPSSLCLLKTSAEGIQGMPIFF